MHLPLSLSLLTIRRRRLPHRFQTLAPVIRVLAGHAKGEGRAGGRVVRCPRVEQN